MKFCQVCNKEFPDSYIFCPSCGNRFSDGKIYENISEKGDTFIACYDLHKTYLLGKNAVNALRGIDLSLKQGDFLAIMGPSGSGKSTLMHILGGLDVPTRGRVLIREGDELIDISSLNKNDLSDLRLRKTGFIFQQFYLLPTLSAEENLSIPLIFSGKPDKFVKHRCKELLKMVGLENRGHHLPSELSGGEQQRVAIARALANDPPIILADEPTGDLDSKTGNAIVQIMKNLNDSGKTIIMVTHDANIAKYSKKIIEMRDGKLIDGRGT